MVDEGYMHTIYENYPEGDEFKKGQIYILNGCVKRKHYMSPSISGKWVDCDAGGYILLCPECTRDGHPVLCKIRRIDENRSYIKDIPVYIVALEDSGYYRVEIVWNQELEPQPTKEA